MKLFLIALWLLCASRFAPNGFTGLDAYLCSRSRPLWLRSWWQRLWVRQNENHVSLNIDHEIVIALILRDRKRGERKREAKYYEDLAKRRGIAHERDIQRMDLNWAYR